MKRIRVRLDGVGGRAMEMEQLKSIYASDMEFEPDERRQMILEDGIVELTITHCPYMVHAKLKLPLYGNIWVMAHNQGKGYSEDFVDFVSEAVRSYLYDAYQYGGGIDLSVQTRAHIAAAEEYMHLANRGKDTAENRLYALSHAVYAAEGALYEASQEKLQVMKGRNIKLGCNFFKYTLPNGRYAKFFKEIFDFATLPFYPYQTVPEKGKYEYGYIDHALVFLKENSITPKGHPLWFGHSEVNPDWLKGLSYEELKYHAREIVLHHVSTYAGKIKVWDAMNEAHDWANCFELSQEELLDLTAVCCWALKEADPQAVSVVNVCLPFAEYVAGRYNCYGSLPEHLCSPLVYLKKVCEQGIPFDVVGIQMYFPARDMVAIHKLLNVFAKLGKKIHITEMGVNGGIRNVSAGTAGSAWAQLDMSEGTWHGGWNERTQADWMEMFYTIAAAHDEIEALTWWDFIEPSFSGNGAFLYEDENPREIFFRLKEWKRKYVNLGEQNHDIG